MQTTIRRIIPLSRVAEARATAHKWATWAYRNGVPAPVVDISETVAAQHEVQYRDRIAEDVPSNWWTQNIFTEESAARFSARTLLDACDTIVVRIRTREYVELTLTTERTQTEDGCVLAGVLTRIGDSVVATCCPGETMPAAIADRCGSCDHCGTARIRRETFVLRKRNGTYMVVGRGCLRPTLGVSPAQMMAEITMAEKLRSFSDRDPVGTARVVEAESLGHVLRAAIVAMRRSGGYKSVKHRDSTRGTVGLILDGVPASDSELAQELAAMRAEMTQADVAEEADRVWKWALAIDPQEMIDFRQTMRQIAAAGLVSRRTMSAAVFMPAAWSQSLGADPIVRSHLPKLVDEPVGSVGDAVTVSVFPIAVRQIQTNWGPSTFVRARTQDGRNCCWYTTSVKALDAVESAIAARSPLLVSGRVKAIREATADDEKTKRTVLSRVRVL